MFCRKCGAELRINAKFCGKCGAPVVPKSEPVRSMPKSEPVRSMPKSEPVRSMPKTEPVRSTPKAEPSRTPSKPEKKPELISSMPKPSNHKADGDIHDWFSDAGDL